MGSIYKRKGSEIYQIKYRDATGATTRESSGTRNRKIAASILRRKEEEAAAGILNVRVKPVQFRELCDLYWERKGSRLSYKGLDSMCKRWAAYFGPVPVAAVDRSKIEDFLYSLKDEDLADSTVTKHLTMMRAMFNWAMHTQEKGANLAGQNPTLGIKKLKEESRERYLEEGEIKSLLEACSKSRSPYLAPVVRIALLTGMRLGEILALEWKRVDFKRKRILIPPPSTKERKPKPVPITDALSEVLRGLKSSSNLKRLRNNFSVIFF